MSRDRLNGAATGSKNPADMLGKQMDESGEGFFQWMIEELNDGLLVLDEKFNLLYLNKTLARIIGKTRQELLGKPITDLFDPVSRKTLVRGFDHRRWGKVETFEQRWILSDGRHFDTIISARPIYGDQGEFRGSFAVVTNITERVKAERALAESEERLRTLINAVPDIICFRDGDGRWIEASDSDLKLFRLEGTDYRGKTHYELARETPEFEKIFRECAKTDAAAWNSGRPLRYEELIELPDGRKVIHDTIKMPLFHENGERKGLVVIGRDITERKAIEEALRESESSYRSLFEDSPISLWVEDLSEVKKYYDELRASGVEDFRDFFEANPDAVIKCIQNVKIIDINRSTLELLAAKSKQQLLSSLALVIPPEEFPNIREEFIALANGATFYRGLIDHIALDGSRKHLIVQFNVVPGYEESLTRVVVSLLDITDLKLAQEETRKSKALLEKTFAGLREAVFIVDDGTGKIVDLNPAATRIFGYERNEMIGRIPSFLFSDEDAGSLDIATLAAEAAGEDGISLPQMTMSRKNGELILTECDLSGLDDESGKRIAWVAVVRDVTEETKVREQLEQAQKLEALGALAGGIAHEVNQPLNALRLYSSSLEMLLESGKELDRDTIMSRLKYILAETDKIKDIIAHMRNLVRQDGAETELEADLNESVRRAVSLVGSQIKSHNIRLDLSLTSGLPGVRANPVQLEQVVINLSINSMQAHDETENKNKWIEISTVLENGQAALRVRDNGPGLDGNCEEIFKPFFTTKNRAGASGMGLGLSLVDTFIRSWGGQIHAAPRPGGGSEFIVLLNSTQTP